MEFILQVNVIAVELNDSMEVCDGKSFSFKMARAHGTPKPYFGGLSKSP